MPPSDERRDLNATAVVVFLAVGILGYWRMKPPPAGPPVTASVVPAANSTSLDPAARTSECKSAEIKTRNQNSCESQDGQKYVWIRPGSFTMGCSAADNECKDDESLPHGQDPHWILAGAKPRSPMQPTGKQLRRRHLR